MSEPISRRKYLKYVGGAAVAVAAVGAGYYAYTEMTRPTITTVNFLAPSGPRWGWVDKALAETFTEKFPEIEITIDELAPAEVFFTKGPLELSSGSPTYDILHVPSEFVPAHSALGYCHPMTDWIDGDDPDLAIPDFREDYGPVTTDLSTWEGDIYYMPHDANAHILYYRDDVLPEYGWPEPPETFDEVQQAVTEIHDPPGHYGWIGMLQPWYAGGKWQCVLWPFGGLMFENAPNSWEPTIDTDVGLDALEYLGHLHEYGVPGELEFYDPDVNEHLGNTGLAVYAPFDYGNGAPSDPSLSKHGDQIKHGRVPVGPAGRASLLGGVGSVINAAAQNKLEAYKYLRYLQAAENGQAYSKATGQHGRISVLRDPANWVPEARHLEALADAIEYDAHFKDKLTNLMSVDAVLGDALHPYLAGEKTAKEALESAQAVVREEMVKGGYI